MNIHFWILVGEVNCPLFYFVYNQTINNNLKNLNQMKTTTSKFVMTVLLVLFAINVYAVEIDGIYYDVVLKGKVAKVTRGNYKGNIVIPKSIICEGIECLVTSIGDNAFRNCTKLTSVVIPNSVTSIGLCAFNGCSGLTSFTIPNSVTSIGKQAFEGCSGLTSVTISNNITDIGQGAFSECINLTSIIIPEGVTIIDGCFWGCSGLTTVIIPNSIKYIWGQAFYGCRNITDVYCYAEKLPSLGVDIFEGANLEYTTLHVPDTSVEQYKAHTVWGKFGAILGLSGKKCEKPTIAYVNGELQFSCGTEGAEFVSEITDVDIKTYNDSKVKLAVTYNISVYATLTGYENSDVATATLCWIETEPTSEDLPNGVTELKAYPVLIQSKDGLISVQGVANGTKVGVYTTNGVEAGNGIATNGTATINTTMSSGEIAIVKIGEKSIKIVIK